MRRRGGRARRSTPPAAGETAEVALPELPATRGETWLTVRAVLAADEPWAPAGHEVAWGQVAVTPAATAGAAGSGDAAARGGGTLSLGPGSFDPATGVLRSLGDLALDGPRLDVWRAPTDNDTGMHGPVQLEAAWRAARAAPRTPPGARGRARDGRAGGPHARRDGRLRRRPARDLHLDGRGGRAAAQRRRGARGGVDGPAAAARAPARAARRASTASSGSGAAPGRPTATPAAPPGSGASRPRSTSSRRRTSARRRTAAGPRCGGPRSPTAAAPACAWRAARTST